MPPPKRMTANPVKPSRHRAGKPAGDSSSESSSGSDSDVPQSKTKKTGRPAAAAASQPRGAGQIISRGTGKIDLPATRENAAAERAALEALAKDAGFETESEHEDGEPAVRVSGHGDPVKEASSEEDSSEVEEDYESSSEEEAPRRLMIRPKFIPKSQRGRTEPTPLAEADAEEERQKAIDALIEEQIRLRASDDTDDESGSDVDTTDDMDPEAEQAAGKLRELKRLKRERDQLIAREKEREEIERRRNMSVEEREREDAEKIAKQKEEKEARGKMGFMQKYYHKGAFYQEEAAKKGLLERDIMGAKFQDEAKRDVLPQALQLRDMTKLGKKGASKYKDLKSEDTGSWGSNRDFRGRDGRGRYEEDERFAPDPDRRSAKGANMIPLGERREKRDDGRDDRRDRLVERGAWDDSGRWDGGRDRRRHDDGRRDDRCRDSKDRRHRDRSRSRSPRRDRDRDEYDRYRSRKREYSRDADRHGDDKRRRVDRRY